MRGVGGEGKGWGALGKELKERPFLSWVRGFWGPYGEDRLRRVQDVR